jgi:hypothetical protein
MLRLGIGKAWRERTKWELLIWMRKGVGVGVCGCGGDLQPTTVGAGKRRTRRGERESGTWIERCGGVCGERGAEESERRWE